MQMVNTRLFEGKEYTLIIYNGQAMLNKRFSFSVCEQICFGDSEVIEFDFPGFVSAYFRVYNERLGRLVFDQPLDKDGNVLVANINQSDMTFEDNGNYYYEIGYLQNGYEQALRYGTLSVI
jgi:hypothetical protein